MFALAQILRREISSRQFFISYRFFVVAIYRPAVKFVRTFIFRPSSALITKKIKPSVESSLKGGRGKAFFPRKFSPHIYY
jgi:hypothetical protein